MAGAPASAWVRARRPKIRRINSISPRSDNFAPGGSSVTTTRASIPNRVRVSSDGKSVFISDEYGPYVRQFDRATGQLIKTFARPPTSLSHISSLKGLSKRAPTRGAHRQQGDGRACLDTRRQDAGRHHAGAAHSGAGKTDPAKKTVRIVTIDIASGATKEYAYNLTTGSGVSGIVALNDHQFLVDERDGNGRAVVTMWSRSSSSSSTPTGRRM